MVQSKALLDTDILSAVMRGNPAVTARARVYLTEHGALAFSIIWSEEEAPG
jgi:predicted nucleic acid-binding protein